MISKRQKFLLALVEELGGELPNSDLQIYLFLVTQSQEKENRSYHFIPDKFGCFSFNSFADKRKLIEKKILEDCENWKLAKDQNDFYSMLSLDDKDSIEKVKKSFGHLSGKELSRKFYLMHPFYAINSEILGDVLSDSEITEIKAHKPKNDIKAIFTIGYEGRSLEEYINLLIKSDVRILVDVRKNAISRKYGFSKKTLQHALEQAGIEYQHIPQLGIASEKRTTLKDLSDYNRLFELYEKEVLSCKSEELTSLYKLVQENERICLTCFEADPTYCHRARIAKAIVNDIAEDLPIVDL